MSRRAISRVLWVLILLPALASAAGPSTKPAAPHSKPPVLPHGVRMLQDVRYGAALGPSNLLDVYLPDPPDADSAPLRPLLVWIHGGGWQAGTKEGCPGLAMVPRGYAMASINYRYSQEAPFPAQIHDCKGAIRFLRARASEYHIDPARVGVWGASAGGHLVALLGTTNGMKDLEGTVGGNLKQSSDVQCVADWFGPTDFVQFHAHAAADASTLPGDVVGPMLLKLFGGTVEEKHDLAVLASPIAHISKSNPPMLIQQGDKDPLVPAAQSQTFYDALKAAGVDATLEIIPGAGHGNGFGTPQALKLAAFFDKNLKPAIPTPQK